MTKTYQYSATGELTYGSATYENEYTYNGESYNPNIQSQYLRARYYSVVTANFLTEDTYLGSINEPLTLNRYNYCISSYPNYMDPGGNHPMLDPIIPSRIVVPDWLPDIKSEDIAIHTIKTYVGVINAYRAANSFGKGVRDSIMKAMRDKLPGNLLPWAALTETLYNALYSQDFPNSVLGESLPLHKQWSPTEKIKSEIANSKTRIQSLTGEIENKNAYYIGRCVGDMAVGVGGVLEIYGGFSISIAGIKSVVPALAGGPYGIALSVTVVLGGVAVAVDGSLQVLYAYGSLVEDLGRYQESRAEKAESDSSPDANITFPQGEAQLKHIFRDAEGHLLDTPENRQKILDVTNNIDNYLGKDARGNDWYAVISEDGTQTWVRVRDGVIDNAGINDVPRIWDPETGLYNNTKK